MTKEELIKGYIAPWIDPGFMATSIGLIAYNGLTKDLADKITDMEQHILKLEAAQ